MRTLPKSALIAALALSIAAVNVANAASVIKRDTGDPFDTTFDLSFDVSWLPNNRADARAYLLGLPADWQRLVLDACYHFVTTPHSYRSIQTIVFCENAFG